MKMFRLECQAHIYISVVAETAEEAIDTAENFRNAYADSGIGMIYSGGEKDIRVYPDPVAPSFIVNEEEIMEDDE